MKVGRTVLGVVQVIDKVDGGQLRQEDLSILTVIADLASTAILNARKIDRFRTENQGLKEELGTRHKII